MGEIYKIVNNITNDLYIGSAISFDNRKLVHLHHLRYGRHHSPILQNSWNKYGADNFIFEIIEIVPNNINLIEREQWWIDYLKPRFNISPIAGSPLGVKHTKKARDNMSKAHLGIKPTKEAIAKRTLKQSGKNHWTYGKERKDDTKELISKTLKEKYKKGLIVSSFSGRIITHLKKHHQHM